MGESTRFSWVLGLVLGACGGGAAATPPPEPPPSEVESDDLPDATTVPRNGEEDAREETAPPPSSAVEPEFRPGMSVDEAIQAVPASSQRVNIEQEALAAPLMKTELYEPCGVKGNQGFSVRVAVWNGRAVGMDISAKPKNDKLEECLREQITSVQWVDKVRSLNTVEFTY